MTITLERPHSTGSDFADLSTRVHAAGLLRRRPGYYAAKAVLTVGAYAAGWVLFVLVGASWWQLATGALLAVAATQVAFLGHDVGHRQVFRSRRSSEVSGLLLGNLGIGMSYGWWMAKHTRHHAHPNHEDHDPDVGAGAVAWTPRQAASRTGLVRLVTRWQAYLFFPLLLLEGMNLHVASAREIVRTRMRRRGLEAVLLAAHVALYATAVFTTLPLGMAFAFLAVNQGLFGLYMGCSFAPNHKGMPILTADDELDYLRRQVLTSRNVTGGRIVDFVLGGLNYQIEHHLFPRMPRVSLRRAQPIVRAFCAERGVSYLESGALSSYRLIMAHLNEVGRAAGRTVRSWRPRLPHR
jgi:fatty acid desaturase